MITFGNIGVLGSGPMGRGFAILLSRAGYDITIGTRHPGTPELADLVHAKVRVSTFRDAAASDIVFLAVVHGAAKELVSSLETELTGKILVSCINAWRPEDYASAGLSSSLTEGSWMAGLIPKTIVVRAFSHINQQYLVPKAITEPGKWAVSYATDDVTSAAAVEDLIRTMGYVPYLVGTLADSAALDYGDALSDLLLTPDEMWAILTRSTNYYRAGAHFGQRPLAN